MVRAEWVGGKSQRCQRGSRESNCERTFSHREDFESDPEGDGKAWEGHEQKSTVMGLRF